ncbi:MAG: hypothetical protein PHX61_01015 [Alphaproteobacteria bacterium]|nr:hypothetical protein [Alphaproteobacteria bacterium]
MEKQIVTDGETKEFLLKTFQCSKMQVWKALHFKSDSDMALRIRTLALKRGGALVGGGFLAECETTHEELEHTMTQRWGRVKLVYNKNNSEVKVYVDNDIKRIVTISSIPELLSLQQEVGLMAQTL